MKRQMLVTGGLTAALLLGGVSAASAATAVPAAPAGKDGCVSVTGGRACFQSYGDVFTAYDTAGDGNHVEARWSVTPGGRSGVCADYGGPNTSKTCNEDVGEGYRVCLTAAVVNGTRLVRSSGTNCTFVA